MGRSMTLKVKLKTSMVRRSLMTIGKGQVAQSMEMRMQHRRTIVTKILSRRLLLKMSRQVKMKMASIITREILGLNTEWMTRITSQMRMKMHRHFQIDLQRVGISERAILGGLQGAVMCKMCMRLCL